MRRALAVFLPLLAVLSLVLWRIRGPEPKDDAAPPSEFSAARAGGQLQTLFAEEVPHPLGTPANVRVRDRIVARFRELGYETRVERRFACNASAVCGTVENIHAAAPGQPSGDPVLVVAHYDSVPAGPGVSDDGMGVAALLEVARIVRGERHRNRIEFLVDDGEEAGLLGAEAYVATGGKAAVVVNVENRGTRGLSNMFETSRGNRWLIARLAGALPMPTATSFFYAVYELLPNDTDVTIFKRAGIAAVNFAAIGGVHWYHTPFDDLAHASPRLLQHHGDNILGAVRAFADADLTARSADNAGFFDVLGFFLVWWPEGWTLWIAVASLVLLMVMARRVPVKTIALGIGATFLALLLAAALGFGVSWIARLRAQEVSWVARPLASIAAMWMAGIAAALFAFAFRALRDPVGSPDERAIPSQSTGAIAGVALVWHALGIALALTMPGAAFLFVVPALLLSLLFGLNPRLAAIVAATAAAILIYPMGTMLYDALGGRLMIAIAVLIAVQMTLVAPLVGRASLAALVLLGAIGCALFAVTLPEYDDAHPLQLSLAYVEDPATPAASWVAGRVTPSLQSVAKWERTDPALTPWTQRGGGWRAPAERRNLPPVVLTADRGPTSTTLRIRSQRGANRLMVVFRGANVGAYRVNGITPPPPPARHRPRATGEWKYALANATEVLEVTVDVPASSKLEVVAADYTFGLPPGSEELARARSDSPAFPAGDGDVTITRARGVF